MRTFSIPAISIALVAFTAACSDGSEGLGRPGASGAGMANSSSGSGASGSPSVGGGSTDGGVSPSGGSVLPDGGTPATNGGTGGGSSGAATTTGGAPPVGGSAGSGGSAGGSAGGGLKQGPFKILVLTTTLAFPHDSIPDCNQMLGELGQAAAPERATIAGLAADVTWTVDQIGRDPGAPNYFSEMTAENLAKYDLVYSNNPTGPVFTNAPQGATKKTIFQTWFENGGSWAGQHSATDFENNNSWTWFDDKVAGGWFTDHDDDGTPGTLAWQPQFANHPILKGLPSPWNTSDEWYAMNRDIEAVPGFTVLAKVTPSKTKYAAQRPAIWITENPKKGRSFYTIQGHGKKVYVEPQFRQLMLRGILWSAHRLPGGN